MTSVKVNVLGVKTTQRFLRNKERKIDKTLLPRGLKIGAVFLQGEVKDSIAGRKSEPTSVNTGHFLGNVFFKFKGKDTIVVFTKVPYAKFLEFGTSRLPARKHFRNSKARNENKVIGIVKAQMKSI